MRDRRRAEGSTRGSGRAGRPPRAVLGAVSLAIVAAWLPATSAALPHSVRVNPGFVRRDVPGLGRAVDRQHQDFYWDFSECFDYTISATATEFVDGARYDLPGGCFVRFGSPGESSLQATFVMAADPRSGEAARGTWTLVIFHLAPRPDDRTRGSAPVQITLNGQEVWRGSPADEGSFGPGRVWDTAVIRAIASC